MAKFKDLTGLRFGRFIAIKYHKQYFENNDNAWECICDCGNTVFARTGDLNKNNVRCVCKSRIDDISNLKFGKLTAIKNTGIKQGHSFLWECKCDCGSIVNVSSSHLKRGHTKSCGCLKKDNIGKFRKLNTYYINEENNVAYVYASNNEDSFAIINIDDINIINSMTWSISTNGYFVSYILEEVVYMHRMITGCNKDMVVDHINGNTIDNRKENLRMCTQQQNTWNKKSKNIYESDGKYKCAIVKDGVRYNKTEYNEDDAIEWVVNKSNELYGEFSVYRRGMNG